jgi:hypothetical protein
LNSFLRIFGDFGILRQWLFHYTPNVGNRQKTWVIGCVSILKFHLLVDVLIVVHIKTCNLTFL